MVINRSSLVSKQLDRLRTELLKTESFLADPLPENPREFNNRQGKSRQMLKLEEEFHTSIEVLLAGDRWAKDIARELRITVSTVSNWRKRLGIESQYSMNKLMNKVKGKVDDTGGS